MATKKTPPAKKNAAPAVAVKTPPAKGAKGAKPKASKKK